MKLQDIVEGEKCKLRTITVEDCNKRYLKWLLDKDTNQYMETRWSEQNLNTITQFVGNMIASENNLLMAIVDRDTGGHIGNIKIGPIDLHNHRAELSYFIGEKDYWGKGYATEAIELATRLAFCGGCGVQIHRMQAGVIKGNEGSKRALEKAGYRLEAVHKEAYLLEGRYTDSYLMIKINEGD